MKTSSFSPDRRRYSVEYEQARGDRFTKQIIIFTMCAIGLILVGTFCIMERAEQISSGEFKQLVSMAVSLLGGMLVKTGIDQIGKNTPACTPGDPMSVQAPPNAPVETTDVDKPNESD